MKNIQRFLMILATVVLVSCGDEKKEQETITIGEEGTVEKTTTTNTTAVDTNSAAVEGIERKDGLVQVNLTGNDQMQFNLKEIRVKAGETVRVTLKHVGQLPKNAMGHNFVLLQQGTDIVDFATKAASASGNDYIPEGAEQFIVHTKMIGGGEEDSIEFTAPEAGTYDFICSFPGHYIQMQGKFIVE